LQAISTEESLQRHISLVPQRALNSYLKNVEKNDYIFHCAGYVNKTECLNEFLENTERTSDSLIC